METCKTLLQRRINISIGEVNMGDLIEKYLGEAKKRKPSFGNNDGKNYVVQINNLDSNDFYKQPFGRQLSDLKKVQEWNKNLSARNKTWQIITDEDFCTKNGMDMVSYHLIDEGVDGFMHEYRIGRDFNDRDGHVMISSQYIDINTAVIEMLDNSNYIKWVNGGVLKNNPR